MRRKLVEVDWAMNTPLQSRPRPGKMTIHRLWLRVSASPMKQMAMATAMPRRMPMRVTRYPPKGVTTRPTR